MIEACAQLKHDVEINTIKYGDATVVNFEDM